LEPITETGALREAINSMLYSLHDDTQKNLKGILYRLSEWLYNASELSHIQRKGEAEDVLWQAAKLTEDIWRFVTGHPELFQLYKKQRLI